MSAPPEMVCGVWVKAHETAWTVLAGEYPRLVTAWQRGETFATCQTVSGNPLTVKLGEVVAIGLMTAVPVTDDDDTGREGWQGGP